MSVNEKSMKNEVNKMFREFLKEIILNEILYTVLVLFLLHNSSLLQSEEDVKIIEIFPFNIVHLKSLDSKRPNFPNFLV